MKCQQCGLEPATVQYTEVIAGRKAMEWLCVACATERGLVVIHAEQDPEFPSSVAPLRPEAPRAGGSHTAVVKKSSSVVIGP